MHGLEVNSNLADGLKDGAGGGARDHDLVADTERAALHLELGHADAAEVLHAAGHVLLAPRGTGAVAVGPLAEALAEVVAVPEATIEDGREALVPGGYEALVEGAVAAGRGGLGVALRDGAHVFRPPRAALDLEDAHAGVDEFVEEMNRLEVFGRHDVGVVDVQLVVRLAVADGVAAAANLVAGAAVGGGVHLVQAEVAFAGDGHAEGAVAEHLEAYGLALGPADVTLADGPMDGADLVQIELAGQDGHVGKAGVEGQGFDVGDVELGGEVDLLTDVGGIAHGGHVGSDNGRDASLERGVDDAPHGVQIGVVEDGVDGQVALHAVVGTGGGDASEVVRGEVVGRSCAHVEPLDAKVDRVGSALNGGHERLVRPGRCHHLQVASLIFLIHIVDVPRKNLGPQRCGGARDKTKPPRIVETGSWQTSLAPRIVEAGRWQTSLAAAAAPPPRSKGAYLCRPIKQNPIMDVRKIVNQTVKIVLPLLLGVLLFWYLYREQDFGAMMEVVRGGVRYDILLFSLLFGLAANVTRGFRWGLLIDSLGRRVRRRNVVFAVLGNYAVNMALPRVGEIWRCGVTAKYERVPFTKLLGTLFVDRIMDTLMVGLLTLCLGVFNIGFFRHFFAENPPTLVATLITLVRSPWTYVGLVGAVVLAWFVFVRMKHLPLVRKLTEMLLNVWEGVRSLWTIEHKGRFLLQTLAIWVGYFLYFYTTFYAFEFTAPLGIRIGLIAFAMSSLGVAVPVQGGIGVWHFMVISTLVAFGVDRTDAAAFALVVFTVQTVWVVLCGLFGIFALPLLNKDEEGKDEAKNELIQAGA